jgi:integrase
MPHNVYRRPGSDNWWIDIQVKGRKRLRRSAGTTDEGRAKALAERLEAQEWNRLLHGDTATLTFAEAVIIYVDDGKPEAFLAPLVKHFKDRLVASIGPEDIKAAAKVLYPDAKPATWNRQVVVPARAVINHAAGKRLASYIRVKTFKELRPVRKAPAADWLPAFMAHANPRIAALALFMRVTAARIGQAIEMRWGAVDLQSGQAIIPAAKGFPERLARLTPELVALLANLEKGKGPVFGYQHHWSIYKPWRKACEDAGIPVVMPHTAGRRAFATAMRAAGVDPKTAAARGGWASIRLMLDVYAGEDEDPGLIDRVFGTAPEKPKRRKRK